MGSQSSVTIIGSDSLPFKVTLSDAAFLSIELDALPSSLFGFQTITETWDGELTRLKFDKRSSELTADIDSG